MGSSTDAPVELYVAAYDDPDAARGDWDAIKQLAQDDVIKATGSSSSAAAPMARSTSTTTSTKPARAPACCRTATAEIKADVEDTLPPAPASSRSRSNGQVQKALSNASNVTKEQVDSDSADQSRLRRPRSCCPGPRAWSDRRRAVVDSYIRVGRARASARCGARTMVGPGGWGALSTAIAIEGKAKTMATRTKTTENGGSASARGSKRGAAVPHLSVAERVARGKAARNEVPRSGHASFEPLVDSGRSGRVARAPGEDARAGVGADSIRADAGLAVYVLSRGGDDHGP